MPLIVVDAPTIADLVHVGWTKDLTVFGAQYPFDSDIMVYREPTAAICSKAAQDEIGDITDEYHDSYYMCASYDFKAMHPVFTGGSVLAASANDTWHVYGLENHELRNDSLQMAVFTLVSDYLAWLEIATYRTAKNMSGHDDPFGDMDEPSTAAWLQPTYHIGILWTAAAVFWVAVA
ncbi:hypothetical protein H4R35_002475 [Dimargaris xerosporica]|nr:hypothetical protein H4R35_002475 [Dimargaris xerosporica]